jgi:hypothetical protein
MSPAPLVAAAGKGAAGAAAGSALDRVRKRRSLVEGGATDAELLAFDEEPFVDENRATATDRRQLRSRARAGEQPQRDAYKAGQRDARARRARRRPAPIRRAARQATAPARRTLRSGFQLLGLTLGLILLYQLLETAEAAPKALQGVLGAPSAVLRWLAAPDRTVLP